MTARSDSMRGAWPRASTIALAAFVAWIGANSIDYVTPLRPGPDAGVYSSIAAQTIEGRVLYKETPEAKPPVIFLLNAMALSMGGPSFHSIRVLERVWATFACLLVFGIVLTMFGRRWLATVTAIAFSMYAYGNSLLEEGNVTEEYALVFVLAGILCVLQANRDGKGSRIWSVGSGASFACAILTKEPFLLSSLPWFLFLILRPREKLDRALPRATSFLLGAAIPLGAFLAYLFVHDAFFAWLDRTVGAVAFIGSLETRRPFVDGLITGFQRFATLLLSTTRTGTAAFAVGIAAALISPAFAARYRFVPLVLTFAFVTEYLGATYSSALYGHYFLQVVPTFVLCAAAGAVALTDLAERALGKWHLLLLLIPCVLDYSAIVAHAQRLLQPFVRAEPGRMSTLVKAHAQPGDRLWVSTIGNSRFYVETGLSSPTPYSHFFPGWFTDGARSQQQKVARLKSDLLQHRPAWVILGPDAESLRSIGLLDWLCTEYALLPVEDQGYGTPAYLYARNDRAGSLASGGRTADTRCASVFVDIGLAHHQLREWVKSIEANRTALAMDSTNVSAYNNLCVSYIQLGEFAKAITAGQVGLVIDPSNTLLQNNLAWARREQARRP